MRPAPHDHADGRRSGLLEQYVVIQPSLDDGHWRLWGQLAGVEGRIVEKALHERADEMHHQGMRPPASMRKALALTTICQDSLDPAGALGETRTGTSPIVSRSRQRWPGSLPPGWQSLPETQSTDF